MKKVIIIFGLILLNASNISAQWISDAAIGVSVCVKADNQQNIKLINDTEQGAIIIWEDINVISTDIYAQRLNDNGIAQWTTNGISICNVLGNQENPNAVTGSNGDVFIVWEDSRGANKKIYAQRILKNGNIKWLLNGLKVSDVAASRQVDPKIISDNAGGCIVVWEDSSTTSNYNIKAQRIDSSGNLLWGLTGITVCNAFDKQINSRIVINSANDIYITWQDRRNGSDYDIYTQKLNLLGQIQFVANGAPVCTFIGSQTNPKIEVVDNTGVFIVWQDKRFGSESDIFAEYINSNGSKSFGSSNLVVCNAIRSQSAIDVLADVVNAQLNVVWKDERVSTSNVNLYLQKIPKSGAVLFTANGIPIATQANNQLLANIITDGVGGAIISYQDSSSGNWNILGQRINSLGTLQWNINGEAICNNSFTQTDQKSIAINNGNSIHVWVDNRNGNNDIYASKLYSNGLLNVKKNIFNNVNISVFPNPSSGDFEINLNNNFPALINVYDLSGKQIIQTTQSISKVKYNLPVGFYVIKMSSEKLASQFKLVIQND